MIESEFIARDRRVAITRDQLCVNVGIMCESNTQYSVNKIFSVKAVFLYILNFVIEKFVRLSTRNIKSKHIHLRFILGTIRQACLPENWNNARKLFGCAFLRLTSFDFLTPVHHQVGRNRLIRYRSERFDILCCLHEWWIFKIQCIGISILHLSINVNIDFSRTLALRLILFVLILNFNVSFWFDLWNHYLLICEY